MHKKTGLVIGFLALVIVLSFLWLRPTGELPVRQVGAAHVTSTWTTPHNVSNSAGGGKTSQRVRGIVDPSSILHAIWMEGVVNLTNGPAYATGQGTSWSSWIYLGANNNRGYVNPAIARDSQGGLHAVWAGDNGPPYRILYRYKPDGGDWAAQEQLSPGGLGNSIYPRIAIDSTDRVWVIWETQITEPEFDVYMTTKPSGGSWSAPVNISQQSAMELEPDIVIDANDVPHVVWRNNSVGWEIYHTRYVGGSWTPVQNISANASASHFPRLAANGQGDVFVVWEDEIDGADRFQTLFRRWDGSQWGGITRASDTPTKALYPVVEADGCNVYSAWVDYRVAGTEIFFSYSTDCGATWSVDENVSNNNSASFFPDLAAEPAGIVHLLWQDFAPGDFDIYYSQGSVDVVPVTPSPTPPSPSPTPTPSPTPIAPSGSLEIAANQPPGNTVYTRLLNVALHFTATSPSGNPIEMRYGNSPDFTGRPWVNYAQLVSSWDLDPGFFDCETKWVYAQYRDSVSQNESPVYNDLIFYDGFFTASMVLNSGKEYTGRSMVMVNTGDLEEFLGCSGLDDIVLWEEGFTQTVWISYSSRIWYFLAPVGPPTRTMYAQYRDRADNAGVLSDSIRLDLTPPYSATAPTLNNGISSTGNIEIPVTGLEAHDDESGMANVHLANRPDGPWLITPYHNPPYTYMWNLAHGGPPTLTPGLHYVYVRYEDDSGYESFPPGNLTDIYTGSISVFGIDSIYLPVVGKDYDATAQAPGLVESDEVALLMVAEPQQAGPGEDVLIWLAARREQVEPLKGALRLTLPEGMRVIRAWSAYGQVSHWDDHQVVSQERASATQVPWILIQARVEEAGAMPLVQGELFWAGRSLRAFFGRNEIP